MSNLWLCWTNNYIRADDGYVIHAVKDNGTRTLCGRQFQEFGNKADDENQPGCRQCLKAMKKAIS